MKKKKTSLLARMQSVPLGSGKRFAMLKEALKNRKVGKTSRGRKMAKALPGKTGKVKNAGALAAWIGRRKYGTKKFAQLSAKGRKRA